MRNKCASLSASRTRLRCTRQQVALCTSFQSSKRFHHLSVTSKLETTWWSSLCKVSWMPTFATCFLLKYHQGISSLSLLSGLKVTWVKCWNTFFAHAMTGWGVGCTGRVGATARRWCMERCCDVNIYGNFLKHGGCYCSLAVGWGGGVRGSFYTSNEK